jgi:hypothetical protein
MPGEWLSQVSEDLRGNEAFTSYATISDFAKGHLEKVSELDGKVKEADGRITDLNARLENAVTIPGENATEAERKAFYQKVGVPDKPEGYEFDADNIEATTDKMFRELMLNSNIPKSSAKSVRKAFADLIKQGTEMQAKAKADQEALEIAAEEKAVNSLKDVWKGDDFKKNVEMASRAWKAVATWAGFNEADAKAFVDETKIGNLTIGNHPFLLRVMHAVATKINDDSMTGGRGGGAGGQKSDEERAKERFPNTKW